MLDRAIRILVADDNAKVRLALSIFIEVYADFEFVGEACNGEEAIVLCEQLKPDLVLMDLVMPQLDGIKATKMIRHRFPTIRILVLTSTVEHDLITAALEAGAQGYLIKNISIDTMAETIYRIFLQ